MSETDLVKELLPCLCCNHSAKVVYGAGDDHWIECKGCGLQTAIFATQEAAISAWNRRAALDRPTDAERRAEFDANVERLKACEHIACGDEGWRILRNECPSTAAVAGLRDAYEALLRQPAAEPSAAEVERAARWLHEAQQATNAKRRNISWEKHLPEYRDFMRSRVLGVFRAARATAAKGE